MRAASWVPASSTPLPTAGAEDKVCPQCGEVFGGGLRFCPKDGSALRASAPAGELVGQVIAERYHVLDKLGEGGMGRVYLAEHIRMGRRCALKVMNPRLLHDPDSVGRFNREAANASRINHPNVAAIYDFGETTDDIVYLAMELVEGESLAAILGREGIIPENRTIQICLQIADALGAAHDLGIVHRDLKPDNVMISRSRAGGEQVKVVDFGIAKATEGGKQTVTRTGYVLGTPAYMSPEQLLGESLDGRSDLYSLGCIIYEMLAGERAFAGPTGEVSIHQRLTEPPPNPRKANPNLSRRVGEVVTTAMARSPEQRFRTASALSEALKAAATEGSQGSSWRGWLPWGQGRPSPAQVPAANSPDATTPVPLGWTEAVQPLPSKPGHNTTLLRHRSARPKGRGAWLVAGSGVAVALVVSLLWRLLAPGPAPESSRVVVDTPEPASTPPVPQASAPPPAPAPTLGAVRLPPSLPADVQVTVDGVEQPLPPDGVMELAPGRHSLAFRARGFRRASRSVAVTVGDTAALDLELIPAASRPEPPPDPAPPTPRPAPAKAGEATLNVAGDLPPGAEISVDGGPLPADTRVLKLAPGMHWVKISAVGYRPDSTQVQVEAGSSTVWHAPRLEPLPRPGPEPAAPVLRPPVTPPPVEEGQSNETIREPGPAPSDGEARAEIQALLKAYEGAINARSLSRLKALYPDMPPERESQWRDLFSRSVRDLKAALSVRSIRPISSAGQDRRVWLATFTIHLTFKPDGGSAQSYRISNTAGVNRESGQWRFATLEEAGE
jgi:serine/threonine-protein kinase